MVGVELALHPPADIAEELTAVDLTESVDLGNVLDGYGEGHGRGKKCLRIKAKCENG
jgi:hypothetical protein